MARLTLAFFNTFQAALNSQPITRFRSNKNQGLLVYLALQQDRPVPRDVLATLLWPEESESNARNNLRQSVYQLRKVLGDLENPDEPYLLASRQTVQFNAGSDFTLDVNQFWQSIAKGDLEAAVAKYNGDLLPGFSCDSLLFEDWLRQERERLHLAALQAMSALTQDYLQNGQPNKAQAVARQQLTLEPWRESAHRQLMQAYALAGDRANALAQYEVCREALWDELGVEPTEETVALNESIKAGAFGPTSNASFEPSREVPHKLPVYATPVIGREAELAALGAYINDPDVRLVTILGPGGIGKTRLATAAAEQVLAAGIFADGLYFVDLAPLEGANQVQHAIADAMNFPLQGGDSHSRDQLINYLRQREILLLLDNYEHLLDSVSLVGDMLQAGPKLKILVTSRERLQLQLEQVYPIEGLASPHWETPEDAAEYGALRLFLQSAQRNQPDFAVRDSNDLTYLSRICRMVDGMPLALELAASWVDVLTLREIAKELQRGLDILETELRDLPARQRSMRASFDYSWRKLDGAQQTIFAQLSIFRGGFTRSAVQEVTGTSLRQLSHLVNKSLIRFDNGSGRYEMHELLRQYGAEKLAQQPEQEALTRDRHSNYYLQLLAGYTDDLKGQRQQQAMSAIEADLDNVLLAWNHASAQQNIEAIGMSLESLWRFQWNFGRRELSEFEQAEADLRRREATGARGIVLGRLLAPLGRSYAVRGDTVRAKAMLEESLDLLLRLGAAEERLTPLLFLAEVQESMEESNRLYREGLVLARAAGDRWAIGHALLFLGLNARLAGDYHEAEQQLHEALKQFRQTGDSGGIVTSLAGLGGLAVDRGRYEDALSLSQESRAAAQGFNPMPSLMGLTTMAQALVALDEYEEAQELFGQGLALFREYGRKDCEDWLFWLGEIAFSTMNYARAAQLYEDSLACAVNVGNVRMIIRNHTSLGRLKTAQGKTIEARKLLRAALQSVNQSSWRPLLLDCLVAIAALFAEEGSLDYAALLATIVTADPATRAMTTERAERLLVHIEKERSVDQLGLATQHSSARDLHTLAAQLLPELETP